ncbi:MAG: aryl-alcohol dehydrogenase-like predicted oxidoreductase [Glaciecola sp.]|jgi:aryl-alcohol dehydrogenase-like predicted oxidoreductase
MHALSDEVGRLRALGSRGPDIATVGIGTWIMGGAWRMGWGPQDDAQSIHTLREAWAAGVNWVDTAPIYGLGHAEIITGRALQGHDDVLVFSKCGMPWNDEGELGPIDLRPETIERECDDSLRRIGRDVIDLYQLHFPDPVVPVEESWGAMTDLVTKGKVRWLGLSNHTLGEVQLAHAVRPVDSVQARLHLLDQRNTGDLLPWCAKEGVGVLAYSPLASGLLASEVDVAMLADDDWRRSDERFAIERSGAGAVLDAMATEVPGTSPVTVAVAWLLAQDGLTAAIVGARTTQEVEALLIARELPLSAEAATIIAAAAGRVAFQERPLWR